MRNLKKFLALVLAMMMVFGMMVTANASSFTDDANVTDAYSEGVDILQAIGVLKGYQNGSLRPGENVLRQEYAAILYRIHSGDVDDLKRADYASLAGGFEDVNVNSWYAGYIGYCYDNGLLKGATNGKFYPEGYITGTEVLTGMLRALGYDYNDELTGAKWAENTQMTAYQVGLTETVHLASLMGNATREQIAQLAYDTLNTPTVIWNPISTGGYQGDNTYYEKDGPTLGAKVFDLQVIPSEVDNAANPAFTALKLPADPFGRPAPIYVVLVKGQIVYEERGAVAIYNGNLTGTEAKAYETNIADIYYNGTKDADNTFEFTAVGEEQNSGSGLWLDDDHGIHGMEIEIYENEDNSAQYDVYVMQAYPAQITDIDDTTGAITLKVYYVGQTTADKECVVAKDPSSSVYTALSALGKDDYVGVYMGPGSYEVAADANEKTNRAALIRVAAELDPVTVNVTDLGISMSSKSLSKLYSGSSEYDFAELAVLYSKNEAYVVSNVVRTIELDWATLWLHNGFVLWVDQSNIKPDVGYAYLYGVYGGGSDADTLNPGEDDYWSDEEKGDLNNPDDKDKTTPAGSGSEATKVRLLMPNNRTVEVKATDTDGIIDAVFTSTADKVRRSDGTEGFGALVWYTISKDASGEDVYELTAIGGAQQDKSITGELKIEQGVAEGKTLSISDGNGLDVEYNDDTVFFVVTINNEGQITWSQTNAYVGIDNVPDTVVKDGTYVAAAAVNDGAIDEAGNEDCVTAILIEMSPLEAATGAHEYFIVVDKTKTPIKTTISGTTVEYYLFDAVVNGVKTTVRVKTSAVADCADHDIVFVSSVTRYTNSEVIIGTTNTTVNYLTHGAKIGGGVTEASGGNITIKSVEPTGDDHSYRTSRLKGVFEVDLTKGTAKKIELSDIKKNNDYTLVIGMADSTNNYLNTLYVIKGVPEDFVTDTEPQGEPEELTFDEEAQEDDYVEALGEVGISEAAAKSIFKDKENWKVITYNRYVGVNKLVITLTSVDAEGHTYTTTTTARNGTEDPESEDGDPVWTAQENAPYVFHPSYFGESKNSDSITIDGETATATAAGDGIYYVAVDAGTYKLTITGETAGNQTVTFVRDYLITVDPAEEE